MTARVARHGTRVLRITVALVVLLLGPAVFPVTTPAGAAELLMFEEAGCPWCRRWRAEVGPGYPHSAEGKRAPLRVIDIRAPRPSGIELAAPVRASPTFVLVDNGREVGRITGYPGADFFWGLLDGLLRKLPPPAAQVPQRAAVLSVVQGGGSR